MDKIIYIDELDFTEEEIIEMRRRIKHEKQTWNILCDYWKAHLEWFFEIENYIRFRNKDPLFSIEKPPAYYELIKSKEAH